MCSFVRAAVRIGPALQHDTWAAVVRHSCGTLGASCCRDWEVKVVDKKAAPEFLAAVTTAKGVLESGQTLFAGGATWDAVAFRQSWVAGTRSVDIVYTLDVDHFHGKPRLRLTVQDYAPSEQARLTLGR